MLAVFQFDSASIELIDRLIGEGRLPVLAELRRGRWEALESKSDLFEAGLYPTMYSGTEIADHGLYYHFMWSPEEQRVRYMDDLGTPPTVWSQLDAAGARSLIIDPYQVWDDPVPGGISFCGWQFRHRVIPEWGAPQREWQRAVRRLGRPPLLADIAGRHSFRELEGMLDVFLAAPARAADLFVDLLSRERFDFSWVSLPSVHLGGHLLWDPSTLDAQDAGSDDRARLESGLTDVYQRADEALGRMIEVLPAGSEAIVFSGLGMGPNTTRSDLLPEMVRRVLSGADRHDDDRPADAIWRLRARIPRVFRRAFNRTVPGVLVREAVARAYTRGFDWRRTQAFALPGDHFGYVRFNLRGREREGIVDPSETDALAEELATGLGTFSDDDGAPAIAAVHRPQIELSGRRLELLPDLVVAWSGQPSTGLTGVVSPRYGRVERREAGTGRTGNHWPGMWVATPPGETDEVQVGRSPQLIDLAATAAARFGVLDGLPGASLLGIHDGP